MGTITVNDEAKAARELIQDVNGNLGTLDAQLAAIAQQYGLAAPAASALLRQLAQLAEHSVQDTITKAQTQVANHAGGAAPLNARDEQAAVLRSSLSGARSSLETYYGKVQVAPAFPRGGAPKAPDALAQYAGQLVANVRALSPNWTAQPAAGVTLDVNALIADLTQKAANLSAAIQSVGSAGSTGPASIIARDDAWSRMHDQRQGLELVMRGMMLMAGMREVEERLFVTHHAHTPAAPTQPAKTTA